MKHVPPDELKTVWSWVRAGLLRVIEKNKESWHPEDVYDACKEGSASLYVIPGIGFYVFRRHTDADGSTVLFVWIVCGDFKEIHVEQFKAVDDLARSMGAKCVRWESTRNYKRFAKVKYYVYEREV